jgi:hypothetical protein
MGPETKGIDFCLGSKGKAVDVVPAAKSKSIEARATALGPKVESFWKQRGWFFLSSPHNTLHLLS